MARLYKKINVYHLAYNLTLEIYLITKNFPNSEEYNITSQIRRASVSIPLNIAECNAKASNKEFVYFLNTAYASAKEVEVLLDLCHDLKYLKPADYTHLTCILDELNAKLFLFLRNVESRIENRRFHFFKKFEENKFSN